MLKYRKLYETVTPFLASTEAVIVTGMRRTGKTTFLRYLFKKINSNNKLFLDLENPLNRKYFEETNYDNIQRALESLGINFAHKAYIFLDEIQMVKTLPSVIKYLIDHKNIKFFLTGSASFYLKNLFSESLAGRKYIFEIFPLSFEEFLTFKDIRINIPKYPDKITKGIFDTISPYYDEYIQFGGFPGVVLKENIEEKKKMLEDIFISFFQQEVIYLGDFKKNSAIRDLMLLIMQRIGSKIDVQKMSKELGLSRVTLNEYLAFLEGTYFLKRVTPFSKGKDTEIRKVAKIYLCDTGLASHFCKLELGHLFENSVFQNLRLKGELNYYQRKSGVEIDFILNKDIAYEVKINPNSSNVRQLKILSQELQLSNFAVVSKTFSEIEHITYPFII